MGKFKEGDRVRIVADFVDCHCEGKTGMVVVVWDEHNEYLVRIDGWTGGHSGAAYYLDKGIRNPEPESRDKWFFLSKDLEPVAQSESVAQSKFKEGDRVRVSKRSKRKEDSDLIGKSGTVYAVQPATGEVLVKFDGWKDGHSGAIFLAGLGRDPEPGVKRDKWILPEEYLDKIEQREREENPQKGKNMQFKIGDRVENIAPDSNRGQKGTIVDSFEVYGTSLYLIRFDDTRRGHSGSFFYFAVGRKNPRPTAASGYWMLFPEDMRLIESGADEKDGAKKPTKRTVVIEITDDGAEAKYFCGGKSPAKQASVRRYHGDKPDDETAAFHALARLFGHKQSDTKDYRERIRTLEDGNESVFEAVRAAYSRLADAQKVLDRIRKD